MSHNLNPFDRLTGPERDIVLAAMLNRGRFVIASRADTRGKAVRAGSVTFFDESYFDLAREYLDAVSRLEKLLFVRESSERGVFELTNFGWLIGRKLKTDAQPTDSRTAITVGTGG